MNENVQTRSRISIYQSCMHVICKSQIPFLIKSHNFLANLNNLILHKIIRQFSFFLSHFFSSWRKPACRLREGTPSRTYRPFFQSPSPSIDFRATGKILCAQHKKISDWNSIKVGTMLTILTVEVFQFSSETMISFLVPFRFNSKIGNSTITAVQIFFLHSKWVEQTISFEP